MAEVMTEETRPAGLAERYRQVRDQTERLAAPLSPEDQTVQSMPDVSPTKWHRAHTSWFFETFLLETSLRGYQAFDPAYAYLFNSYYETVGARYPRAQRGLVSRPGVGEVGKYRSYVDEAMEHLLGASTTEEQGWLVELGLHHEQQHQELVLMDIKHVLSCNPLLPTYVPATERRPSASDLLSALPASLERSAEMWIEHPGGLVEIGHHGPAFSFDNETPRHAVQLVPFSVSRYPVTCAEWLAFMADGGYRRPELWLSDGWASVQEHGWDAPLYWSRSDDEWQVFTLHGPRVVEPTDPVVHISYYEADAFARWAGARLPTEAEWETVVVGDGGTGRFLSSGPQWRTLHPLPTAELVGEVWQWTSSAYGPYPGFTPAPGAVGEYNGKFMVNQMVLRGGSCVTPEGHIRATYRNFFPAPARWAFSGLRLARDC